MIIIAVLPGDDGGVDAATDIFHFIPYYLNKCNNYI